LYRDSTATIFVHGLCCQKPLSKRPILSQPRHYQWTASKWSMISTTSPHWTASSWRRPAEPCKQPPTTSPPAACSRHPRCPSRPDLAVAAADGRLLRVTDNLSAPRLTSERRGVRVRRKPDPSRRLSALPSSSTGPAAAPAWPVAGPSARPLLAVDGAVATASTPPPARRRGSSAPSTPPPTIRAWGWRRLPCQPLSWSVHAWSRDTSAALFPPPRLPRRPRHVLPAPPRRPAGLGRSSSPPPPPATAPSASERRPRAAPASPSSATRPPSPPFATHAATPAARTTGCTAPPRGGGGAAATGLEVGWSLTPLLGFPRSVLPWY
jgi:hypothetical protein